jgi:hypothetical protein
MSSAKLVVVSGLAAVALAGCGTINIKPAASTGSAAPVSRGKLDDPRTTKNNRVECLRGAHLAVQEVGATGLQVGSPSTGPSVVFEPTAGAAQSEQIQARVPGAEVIGSALVYPNHAPDAELELVEGCVAKGVSG